MWSALFGFEVSAEQVAQCMIAMKLARARHSYRRDNYVDIAGYAQVAVLCAEANDVETAD